MFLTFDPDIFYYHNILSGEEQYFFGKGCYTMTAYVKIRQILCAFEEGKVTKKTKTGGYYLYEKKKVGTGCHDSCNSFSDAWNKSRSDG
jgi:hypothetical protein